MKNRIPREILEEEIKNGATQTSLAKKYGVGRTTISRWLNWVPPKPYELRDRGKHYVYLPCLREKMKLARASILGLAEESGVSARPIISALRGGRVTKNNARYLYEALNTRTFNRSPVGKQL